MRRCPQSARHTTCGPPCGAELAARTQRRRWAFAGWAAACIAAAFTLVIAVRGGLEAWHEAQLARQTKVLVADSQQLEQRLRTHGGAGRVVNGRTVGTIVQLEDRIAVVDAQLAVSGPNALTRRMSWNCGTSGCDCSTHSSASRQPEPPTSGCKAMKGDHT